MKFYGDLLKVIPFKNNTRLIILKSSKQINFCARFAFLKFILDHFVDYSEFLKFNNKLKKFIKKLKNVTKTDKLPKLLTHLQFEIHFNQSVDKLPSSLIYLKFGSCFNQKVDKLSKSLIYLQFGWNFNQKVDQLPSSLIYLQFGAEFNQLVDKLPKSLIYIQFGAYFNKKVDRLPKSLIYIQFGICFNKKVDHLSMDCIVPQKPIKIIKFHEIYKKFNHSPNHLKNVQIKYWSY
jgi:hypothetical protein